MKKKERETLSQQSDSDLAEKQKQLTEASWKLRLQKATGQLEDPSRLGCCGGTSRGSRRTGERRR